MTVGKQDFRLDGHTDYVRSAAVNPSSQDTWATAGYDHICKLWDVRSQECVMNLDHGAPIEDVAFFPSGMEASHSSSTKRASSMRTCPNAAWHGMMHALKLTVCQFGRSIGSDSWRHLFVHLGHAGRGQIAAAAEPASENHHLCCPECLSGTGSGCCSSHAVWLP